jgi:hypothetical protein
MDPGEPAALEDEELGTAWAASAARSGCVDPLPTDQYLHPHRLAGGRAVAAAVAVWSMLFTAPRRVELQPASTPPGDDQARPATGEWRRAAAAGSRPATHHTNASETSAGGRMSFGAGASPSGVQRHRDRSAAHLMETHNRRTTWRRRPPAIRTAARGRPTSRPRHRSTIRT